MNVLSHEENDTYVLCNDGYCGWSRTVETELI